MTVADLDNLAALAVQVFLLGAVLGALASLIRRGVKP